MLTLPVFRALPCAAGVVLAARAFDALGDPARRPGDAAPPRSHPRGPARGSLSPAHRGDLLCVNRARHFACTQRNTAEMGAPEVTGFLSSLSRRRVAVSTKNEALSAHSASP
jgi:hypothetical protein